MDMDMNSWAETPAPAIDAMIANVERGTYLAWNGGEEEVWEYLRFRNLPAGYCRLVLDREKFFQPSVLPGIAGKIDSAKRLLEGSGVIEKPLPPAKLVPLHGRWRDDDEAEMASVEAEERERLKAGAKVMATSRPLTEEEHRSLWQALAKTIENYIP